MDVVSGAASVAAIVQITGQKFGLCQTYYTAVKSSRQDIQRLRNEVDEFSATLTRLVDIVDASEPSRSLALKNLLIGLCKDAMET